MNKRFFTPVWVMIVFVLTGCAKMEPYVDKGKVAVTTIQNMSELQDGLKDVENAIHLHSGKYTEDEVDKIKKAEMLAGMVATKVSSLGKTHEIPTYSDVKYFYGMAKDAYKMFSSVVSAHWDEYDAGEKVLLTRYDQRAIDTGTEIQKIIDLQEPGGELDALALLGSLIKAGIKIGGML